MLLLYAARSWHSLLALHPDLQYLLSLLLRRHGRSARYASLRSLLLLSLLLLVRCRLTLLHLLLHLLLLLL